MKAKHVITTFAFAAAMALGVAGGLSRAKVENVKADADFAVYLKPNANWKQANARFAVYCFGSENQWVDMAQVVGDTDYYTCMVDKETYPNIIFCRMNPSTTANNWDNKWNQTQDLTYQDGKDLCTIADDTWDNSGSWSTYVAPVAPDPVSEEKNTYYLADSEATLGAAPNAYAWTDGNYTPKENAAWPGEVMTKVKDGLFKIEVSETYEGIIFNGNEHQTDNLTATGHNGWTYDYKAESWETDAKFTFSVTRGELAIVTDKELAINKEAAGVEYYGAAGVDLVAGDVITFECDETPIAVGAKDGTKVADKAAGLTVVQAIDKAENMYLDAEANKLWYGAYAIENGTYLAGLGGHFGIQYAATMVASDVEGYDVKIAGLELAAGEGVKAFYYDSEKEKKQTWCQVAELTCDHAAQFPVEKDEDGNATVTVAGEYDLYIKTRESDGDYHFIAKDYSPDPISDKKNAYYFCGDALGATPYAHAWTDGAYDPASTTWPGVAMTKLEDGLFKVEVSETYEHILFNNGEEAEALVQTVNLTATADKYFTVNGAEEGKLTGTWEDAFVSNGAYLRGDFAENGWTAAGQLAMADNTDPLAPEFSKTITLDLDAGDEIKAVNYNGNNMAWLNASYVENTNYPEEFPVSIVTEGLSAGNVKFEKAGNYTIYVNETEMHEFNYYIVVNGYEPDYKVLYDGHEYAIEEGHTENLELVAGKTISILKDGAASDFAAELVGNNNYFDGKVLVNHTGPVYVNVSEKTFFVDSDIVYGGYHLLVGNSFVELSPFEPYEDWEQVRAQSVSFKAGDEIRVINTDHASGTSLPTVWSETVFDGDADVKNKFAVQEGKLMVTADVTTDVYLKLKFEDNMFWFGAADPATTEATAFAQSFLDGMDAVCDRNVKESGMTPDYKAAVKEAWDDLGDAFALLSPQAQKILQEATIESAGNPTIRDFVEAYDAIYALRGATYGLSDFAGRAAASSGAVVPMNNNNAALIIVVSIIAGVSLVGLSTLLILKKKHK